MLKKFNDYFLVHTTHAVLHARHITLPNPKTGGLLNMKLNKIKPVFENVTT